MKIVYRPSTPLVCAHLLRLAMRSMPRLALATAGFAIPFAVAAQSADRDPLNAQTTAPRATYDSAFIGYKPYQDPELISWRTANDVVREFGSMASMGNMDHAKTPEQKDGGDSKSAQPSVKPTHDMSKMAPSAPAPATQKSVAPISKPAEKQTTPAHDMSKMRSAPAAPAAKASQPSGKPATPASAPGHEGMSH